MSDLFIFMFGTIVMSIFAAGVYTFARIKFERLDSAEISKDQKRKPGYPMAQRRYQSSEVEHH